MTKKSYVITFFNSRSLQSNFELLKLKNPKIKVSDIFFKKENEKYPLSQIVLMVILVISAVVGTSGTVIWIRSIMVQKRRQSNPSSEIITGMYSRVMSVRLWNFKGGGS